jgi:hypothetical protein
MNIPFKHTYIYYRNNSVFAKICYFFCQKDHHLAKLLQKYAKEHRIILKETN